MTYRGSTLSHLHPGTLAAHADRTQNVAATGLARHQPHPAPPPERAPSPPPPPSAPHPPPRRRPPTPPPRRAAHVTRHPSGAGTSRPVPHITPKHPECDLLRTPRVQSGDRHLADRRGSTSARRDLRRRGAAVAVGGGGAALQPLHRMPREERPDADPTNRRSAAIRSTKRRTLNGEGAVRRPPRLVRLVRLPFPPLIAPPRALPRQPSVY